jgi:hypothetical protein
VLPKSENIEEIKHYFFNSAHTLKISDKNIQNIWERKLYRRLRKINTKYLFYNTNYLLELLHIFGSSGNKLNIFGKVNPNLFRLYLIFKYAYFSPTLTNKSYAFVDALREFLSLSTYKYINNRIKDITLIHNNPHSKIGAFLTKIEKFYYAEYPEMFDKMILDIEFDMLTNRKINRLTYYANIRKEYSLFLKSRDSKFLLLFGNYYSYRAQENVRRALDRIISEIKLYGIPIRRRKLINGCM